MATAKDSIKNALQVGVQVESDDPRLGPIVSTITPEQIDWIAAWLAGEGFVR